MLQAPTKFQLYGQKQGHPHHYAKFWSISGFGVPQTAIALETTLSELASAAGIDELDFRLRNCLRNGDPTVTGQSFETGLA